MKLMQKGRLHIRPSARNHRHRGSSLLELTVAMAVFSIAMIGFLSGMMSFTNLSASSRESTMATYEFQTAIEETFAIPYGQFKVMYPDEYVFPPSAYNRLPDETMVLTWLSSDPAGNWVEYQVEINYTDHRDRTVTATMAMRRSK